MKKLKIDDHVIITESSWPGRVGREVVIVAVLPEMEQIDVVFASGDSGVMTTRWDWVTPIPLVGLAAENIAEGDFVSFMEKAGLDTTDPTVKDSNPKDAIGCTKPSTHFIPKPVLYEVGNVLFSGARKYGAFNWRVAGVRASVYQNAAGRHTDAWQEGEDLDPDTGIHHLSHAIAGLMIIRDAMIQDKFVDDRPPSSPADWMKKAQEQTDAIIERQPNVVDPYTQVRKDSGDYD